jgi:hypothetical protein
MQAEAAGPSGLYRQCWQYDQQAAAPPHGLVTHLMHQLSCTDVHVHILGAHNGEAWAYMQHHSAGHHVNYAACQAGKAMAKRSSMFLKKHAV